MSGKVLLSASSYFRKAAWPVHRRLRKQRIKNLDAYRVTMFPHGDNVQFIGEWQEEEWAGAQEEEWAGTRWVEGGRQRTRTPGEKWEHSP